MAVSSLVYPNGIKALGMGTIVWAATGGSSMYGSLVLDSEVPAETDDFRNDVSEASGGSYAALALTLTDPTVDTTNNQVEFDVSNATLTFSSPTASQVIGGMLVYKNVGTAATDNIMCLCDFTLGNVTSDGTTDIVVTPGADGLFKITWTSF